MPLDGHELTIRAFRSGSSALRLPRVPRPARSPPMEVNGQQLIAPKAVAAIPELEFDQTANLLAGAEHDRLMVAAGADAEPIPALEFDQTLGL